MVDMNACCHKDFTDYNETTTDFHIVVAIYKSCHFPGTLSPYFKTWYLWLNYESILNVTLTWTGSTTVSVSDASL